MKIGSCKRRLPWLHEQKSLHDVINQYGVRLIAFSSMSSFYLASLSPFLFYLTYLTSILTFLKKNRTLLIESQKIKSIRTLILFPNILFNFRIWLKRGHASKAVPNSHIKMYCRVHKISQSYEPKNSIFTIILETTLRESSNRNFAVSISIFLQAEYLQPPTRV